MKLKRLSLITAAGSVTCVSLHCLSILFAPERGHMRVGGLDDGYCRPHRAHPILCEEQSAICFAPTNGSRAVHYVYCGAHLAPSLPYCKLTVDHSVNCRLVAMFMHRSNTLASQILPAAFAPTPVHGQGPATANMHMDTSSNILDTLNARNTQ
ncbi:hypothetical protein BD413DRAFT_195821 [Trametes elegans]|nr:hypothetical protein BD413DRAFT_195821 [Trametes elegans]